ncbi:kynureninase [Actibacterium sp. 188UL27-1]|uniref:kynureninase n=1 Tax=Actibacterium sp. 188UL27-1 TaxID=2786961 RepID=UPI0019566B88|nr:kynureninase [Actibacterium sp. 188UL27-1]MBM7067014.1 kynureninase [Actibacterium sp. 188UL27-1]
MKNTVHDLPIKERFDLPEGVIYLDGNSLGPLPKGTSERLQFMLTEEWGGHLITGWNRDGWMEQPARVGNQVARLIGAPDGSVTIGDTLSIKVYQALSAALKMRPRRRVILSDSGNFPSDLYMAQGLIGQLDQGYELRIVDPEEVADAMDETVAVAMITQVDYRTGRMHDMNAITLAAHTAGAVMVWDLAHSAGAVPVDLVASNSEFAVGCTYKYLNGGPGAPAFIYVRRDIAETVDPALAGWLGHDAPFAFELDYRPAPGIGRMRVGTPPVMQMTALEHALGLWDSVDMAKVRRASVALSDCFIREVEARCPALTLVSPRDSAARGSQVSFAFDNGYAAMQALIDRNVIGDFRAPNIMRFGFTPLYIDEADVRKAVDVIEDVINNGLWKHDKYKKQALVT